MTLQLFPRNVRRWETRLTRNKSARGIEREDLYAKVKQINQSGKRLTYPGKNAFKSYDTFGLPLDFIQDVVRDFGLELIRRDLIARKKSNARGAGSLERRA